MRHVAALLIVLMLFAPAAAVNIAPRPASAEEVLPIGPKTEARLDRGGEVPPLQGPAVAGVASSPYLDVNRNRIFDTLEIVAASTPPGEKIRTIVVLNQPPTAGELDALRARHDFFSVYVEWTIIPAFAAELTLAQLTSLSRDPEVRHIEHDAAVSSHMYNAARRYFGVDKAKADFPFNGDRDGSVFTYSPEDVVICVIDTGIYAAHSDLDEKQVIGWKDFINKKAAPYDDNGHGTHVAGIAAGQGDANEIVRGVAHGAGLVGVKVLDANGTGTWSGVISGIEWCTQNKAALGIEIINLSLGAAYSSDGTEGASLAADAAWDAGIVVLAAAGNAGPDAYTIGAPGAAKKIITVGAMSDLGASKRGFAVSAFSSRGPTLDGRVKPDIMGPGEDITSVGTAGPNAYISYSGTSMATPFVAGVVALMLDANPNLTPNEVKTLLYRSAQDWRGDGRDKDTGAGRLQAYHALRLACPTCTGSDPPVPPHYARADDIGTASGSDRYGWYVDAAGWPLAATLIVPQADSQKDFDLYLYDPDGNLVASSAGLTRQETLSHAPMRTGTYTLRVASYSGVGGYYLDFSGGSLPYLRSDQ